MRARWRRAWWTVAMGVLVPGVVLACLHVQTSAAVVLSMAGAAAGFARRPGRAVWPQDLGPCSPWSAAAVVATWGWIAAGAPWAAVLVAGPAATAWLLGRPTHVDVHRVTGPASTSARTVGGQPGSDDVRAMSDEDLCRLWRTSYPDPGIGSTAPALVPLSEIRQTCLDEVEQRHPAGFAAWMLSGARAAGNPEPCLRAHR